MNLREIRAAYPHLFYHQIWWDEEPFAYLHIGEPALTVPAFVHHTPMKDEPLPLAVLLTWTYVLHTAPAAWDHWFWCADKDRDGRRVYVGRKDGLWEIHRHLALTNRWGVAVWP